MKLEDRDCDDEPVRDTVRSMTVSPARKDAERRKFGLALKSSCESEDIDMTESSDLSRLDSVRERESIRLAKATLGFVVDDTLFEGLSMADLDGEKLNKSDKSFGADLDVVT